MQMQMLRCHDMMRSKKQGYKVLKEEERSRKSGEDVVAVGWWVWVWVWVEMCGGVRRLEWSRRMLTWPGHSAFWAWPGHQWRAAQGPSQAVERKSGDTSQSVSQSVPSNNLQLW